MANIFKIEEDLNINNAPRTSNSPRLNALCQAIKALPIDPNKSISIPQVLITNDKKAYSLAITAKNKLKKEGYEPSLKIRKIFDAEKRYVSTRIFKISEPINNNH